jgi:hypothetical protein
VHARVLWPFLHCWDGTRKHDNVDANDQKPNEPQEENVEVTTIVLGLRKEGNNISKFLPFPYVFIPHCSNKSKPIIDCMKSFFMTST